MPKPLNILVVDDQAGVRYLLNIIIQEEGHKVCTAQNGKEAVDMVSALHPDLVFMDVRMPVMSGLEALRKIRMMAPHTEVVIMTAYGTEDTVETAMQCGALTYIAKPFDVKQIKTLIRDFSLKSSSGAFVCTNTASCG